MLRSALLLIIGTAQLCSSSKKITVDLNRVQRKDSISLNEKYGFNAQSSREPMSEKHNLKQTRVIPIDLNSRLRMAYSGPVFLGDSQKIANVIYDTGSDWLTVTSTQCDSTCNS